MQDIPTIRDPIYNVDKSPKVKLENATAYNKWRASLPKHCYYNCRKFNTCYPSIKCPYNRKAEL